MVLVGLTLICLAQASFSVRLSDLDLSNVQQDWGDAARNRSVGDHPLTIDGQTYPSGLGTHANGNFVIDLKKSGLLFTAKCGVDDETDKRGSVRFMVLGDGKLLAGTPVMHGGDAAQSLSVDVRGVHLLTLRVDDAGDGIDYDHADWIDPEVTLAPGTDAKPVSYVMQPEPTMEIAHGWPDQPRINGARVVGCTAGRAFLFRIPVTGQRPLHFWAEDLPAGLALDASTGIISGSVQDKGRFTFQVHVSGPAGSDSHALTIDSNGLLALTPPMGWNSWNVWGTSVTAEKVLAAAKGMEDSGLANVGYSTVNIDDAWEGPRDANGEITTNEKFGDMKALADQIHAMGLHLGIYSSPGPTTCAGYPASYEHEQQDADTYSKWGIDYLKYDWCSYGGIAKGHTLFDYEQPYLVMRNALDHCGRDIVFSLCQYGMGDVWNWGREVGGNLWRVTGDITDSWSSMCANGFSQSDHGAGIGPGGWNDPDMLVVGNLGWGDHPHPTHLTPNEQITHITLWSMLAAPLLMGCDLSHVDSFTRDVLGNPDVIDVDQDALGNPGKRVYATGQTEVWARPVVGGWAVALFNRGDEHTTIRTEWQRDLGIDGSFAVRDCWERKDKGTFDGGYEADVPAHGARLLFVKR